MAVQSDPYYWSRDLFAINAQQKALGQSKGYTPEALSRIVTANFRARQEEERQDQALQLDNRRMALAERNQAFGEKQAKQQAKAGGFMGAANLAINVPLAYRSAKDLGWWGTGAGAEAGAGATAGAALPSGTTALDLSLGDSIISPTTGLKTKISSAGASQAGITAGEVGLHNLSLSTAMPIVGAGALGYTVGSNLIHGKWSKEAGIGASIIAGWMAGGSVGGPVGGVIGGVVGALSSMF